MSDEDTETPEQVQKVKEERENVEKSYSSAEAATDLNIARARVDAGQTDEHFMDPDELKNNLEEFKNSYTEGLSEYVDHVGGDISGIESKNEREAFMYGVQPRTSKVVNGVEATDGQASVDQLKENFLEDELETMQEARQGPLERAVTELDSEVLADWAAEKTGVEVGSDFYKGQNRQLKLPAVAAVEEGNYKDLLQREAGYE